MTTNGRPQFQSEAFRQFCHDWGILNGTSSPYHDGYADKAVKAMKEIIRKLRPGKKHDNDMFKAILEYRNTSRKGSLSPAQRLFGKPMKTLMTAQPHDLPAGNSAGAT